MKGTGSHLHSLIKRYTGEDYTPGCGCRAVVRQMDENPPQWSLDNMPMILKKLRMEARARKWWAKFALALPFSSKPLRWMIREAARLAQEELDNVSTDLHDNPADRGTTSGDPGPM